MSDNDQKSLDVLGVKPLADAVNTATTRSFDGASAFLSRICLPAAEEFGLLLRDRVSAWRASNALKITQKAEALLNSQKGSENKHAHPRLVAQIMEQGSWIETDELHNLWAGLLTSSCTDDGKDDSNLMFIDLLSRLSASQALMFEHFCENVPLTVTRAGWLLPTAPLSIDMRELQKITNVDDIHRLDRELDHLRALGLIDGGSEMELKLVVASPTTLGLHMYTRCHGYIGDPKDYFGVEQSELSQEVKVQNRPNDQ
ncbi:MAG: Abi-alpha family protein [Chloroflexota bacterium]|nr:Abi-alpha family protein [Chloroflexota bacterium]